MRRTTIAAVLVLAIAILAPKTRAELESGNRQTKKIIKDDFIKPESESDLTEDRGREIFRRDTTTSFPDTTTSPLRRRVRRAVLDRYTRTPGVGIHIIHTNARTWHQARGICLAEGGDLAVINSWAESQAIAELIQRSYPHYNSDNSGKVIIGYNDLMIEGQYVTVDGTSLYAAGFSEWTSNELSFNSRARGNRCGAVWKDGLLCDIDCSSEYAFACELPLSADVVPQGIPGIKGDPGPPGLAGMAGQKGDPGERGRDGPQGAAGEKGSQGNAGSPGLAGLKGEKGDLGMPGFSGIPGPVGPPGADGLNGRNGKDGPPGAVGLKGERGDPGMVGVAGLPGQDGLPGLKGSTGETGSPGLPGPIGIPGEQGPIGPIGPEGAKGEPGPGYDAACLAVLSSFSLIDGGGGDSPSLDDDVPEQQCKRFIAKAYEQISGSTLENSVPADGHRESPAVTCKDLFAVYPDKPSDDYWIDPNGGDVDDAILVHCDAVERATCVKPKSSRSPNISYTGDEREVWLSDIEDGMQITYTADSTQISALQIMSKHAAQTVVYHCMKSIGYFDAENQTYHRGLTLSAWNEVELSPRGRQRLRYDMISDECRDRLDEWRKTVIIYRTDKPVLLPIMDVGLRDVGKPDQRFSIEIGDVCFR